MLGEKIPGKQFLENNQLNIAREVKAAWRLGLTLP